MALGAQGFADRRPTGRIDVRHFRRLLTTLGVIQIDSVNVLARAHYLPAFARLGSYSRPAFDDFLWRSREAFEYWGHEASFIPVSSWPLFAHRMVGGWHWQSIERLAAEHPGFVQSVLDEVGARGPLTAGDLDEHEVTKGTWWDWGKAKLALEWLFLTGNVTVAERRIKSIFIHAFQDVETFDLSRVRRCCQAYPQPDGRLIPICVHNVLRRKPNGVER